MVPLVPLPPGVFQFFRLPLCFFESGFHLRVIARILQHSEQLLEFVSGPLNKQFERLNFEPPANYLTSPARRNPPTSY